MGGASESPQGPCPTALPWKGAQNLRLVPFRPLSEGRGWHPISYFNYPISFSLHTFPKSNYSACDTP